jgi:hypothetical protein
LADGVRQSRAQRHDLFALLGAVGGVTAQHHVAQCDGDIVHLAQHGIRHFDAWNAPLRKLVGTGIDAAQHDRRLAHHEYERQAQQAKGDRQPSADLQIRNVHLSHPFCRIA